MLEPRHILDVKKQQIKEEVLDLFDSARDAIERSVGCIETIDKESCDDVIENDRSINEARRLLEQDCLVAIASQQPVAHDLREIVAAMRIASELERIGDYAADIAVCILDMDDAGMPTESTEKVAAMVDICLRMFDQVSAAYEQFDPDVARDAALLDDEIDDVLKEFSESLMIAMQSQAGMVRNGSRMLWVAHNLERCGDRLTNIAEQVVFVAESEVVDLD